MEEFQLVPRTSTQADLKPTQLLAFLLPCSTQSATLMPTQKDPRSPTKKKQTKSNPCTKELGKEEALLGPSLCTSTSPRVLLSLSPLETLTGLSSQGPKASLQNLQKKDLTQQTGFLLGSMPTLRTPTKESLSF